MPPRAAKHFPILIYIVVSRLISFVLRLNGQQWGYSLTCFVERDGEAIFFPCFPAESDLCVWFCSMRLQAGLFAGRVATCYAFLHGQPHTMHTAPATARLLWHIYHIRFVIIWQGSLLSWSSKLSPRSAWSSSFNAQLTSSQCVKTSWVTLRSQAEKTIWFATCSCPLLLVLARCFLVEGVRS